MRNFTTYVSVARAVESNMASTHRASGTLLLQLCMMADVATKVAAKLSLQACLHLSKVTDVNKVCTTDRRTRAKVCVGLYSDREVNCGVGCKMTVSYIIHQGSDIVKE